MHDARPRWRSWALYVAFMLSLLAVGLLGVGVYLAASMRERLAFAEVRGSWLFDDSREDRLALTPSGFTHLGSRTEGLSFDIYTDARGTVTREPQDLSLSRGTFGIKAGAH